MTTLLRWLKWARAMGIRYIAFRLFYEFKLRTGILKFSFPVSPQFQTWITLSQWRSNPPPFFFESRASLRSITPSSKLREEAQRIKAGEIQFFQGTWKKMQLDEWLLNLATGYRYSNKKHWTEIPDFNPSFGDIKYVWEKSRFTFLQTILRNDATFDEDSSAWVFSQIESWITHNPINQGPNYRCSQESSLRVFNWILALYFYKDSVHLTEARFEKIVFSIYWQMKHVRANIHFSRIAVRNNHAITETLGLYTAGLLFPFFKESGEWKKSGKKWLEEEILYQIYPDGAYLQFSFNYHRVVVQLLTWAFSISELHRDYFRENVYDRAYRSLVLLATCQDRISGQLPNYGANDGSLFFSWNDESYRNFSPALDALHYFLTGVNMYSIGFEDRMWFGLSGKSKKRWPRTQIKDGCHSFTSGGLYVFRNERLLVLVICTSYKDRPSQADNLHVDVWYDGKNVLRDAGSYLYNTDQELVKYFGGTESHNTVMLEDTDQMQKGSRFIWWNWSSGTTNGWFESDQQVRLTGVLNAFQNLGDVTHIRTIHISKSNFTLQIEDKILGSEGKKMRQIWHVHPDAKLILSPRFQETEVISIHKKRGFYSPTYGIKENAEQIDFVSEHAQITTEIVL